MKNDVEVHSRPLLFDRVQVNVTPDYLKSDKILDVDSIKNDFIDARKKKDFRYNRWISPVNNGYTYFIKYDCKDFEYVSDIKISTYHPFTVTFKVNFIRILRHTIKNGAGFRKDYDKDILLDEDNYLNYENWSKWDNNIISETINQLYDLCISIASNVMYDLICRNPIRYQNVTVTELETNIDYFVCIGNSLDCIERFAKWIDTDDGDDFKKGVSEIAMRYKMPYDDKIDKVTSKVKNESVSVQFKIGNGLYFKVYRKDRDHIRVELTFKRDCLRSRFKEKVRKDDDTYVIKTSRNIKRIAKATIEFSKMLFKDADMESILLNILKGEQRVYDNKIAELYRFNNMWNSELNNIYDHILYGYPITDVETLKFIRRRKMLRRCFYTNAGKYFILYWCWIGDYCRTFAF